jgi:hypothetical protein
VNYCRLTPFPVTNLYADLDKEGRIIDRDWAKYDRQNMVFLPRHFTPPGAAGEDLLGLPPDLQPALLLAAPPLLVSTLQPLCVTELRLYEGTEEDGEGIDGKAWRYCGLKDAEWGLEISDCRFQILD